MATKRKPAVRATTKPAEPQQIVTRFLNSIVERDYETMAALLAPNLRYDNVSLPSMHGGPKVARFFEGMLRNGGGFEVQIHRIATNGDLVMTERTDMLKKGRFATAFWVCGTFKVEDGRIVLWRDYFDWYDIARGSLRGLAALAIPKLRARLPIDIGA